MNVKYPKYVQSYNLACFVLALLVLSLSIPIYAFNRSSENVASSYCLLFLQCFPDWITSGLSGCARWLKQIPFCDDGLPSAIWCFSWTLILLIVWDNAWTNRIEKIIWCLLPVVLNTAWELLQYVGTVNGVGSITDCAFGFLGGLFAFTVRMATVQYREVIS